MGADRRAEVLRCDEAVKGRSCVRESGHVGPHAASQAFADTLDEQRRAAKQGLRQGKWGFPVTKCPYAPNDRSSEAVAWRKGWTLGNTEFRRQTEGRP